MGSSLVLLRRIVVCLSVDSHTSWSYTLKCELKFYVRVNGSLPGGESNPALARSEEMTGACTNPIYYQGLENSFKVYNIMFSHKSGGFTLLFEQRSPLQVGLIKFFSV